VFNQPNVTAVIRNFVSLGSKAGEISTRRLKDRKPRMGYRERSRPCSFPETHELDVRSDAECSFRSNLATVFLSTKECTSQQGGLSRVFTRGHVCDSDQVRELALEVIHCRSFKWRNGVSQRGPQRNSSGIGPNY